MKKTLYNKKKAVTLLMLCVLIFSLYGCIGGKEPVKYTNTGFAMGTTITELIYSTDEDAAANQAAEILNLLTGIENQKISWRINDSEVYKINHSNQSVAVSEDTYEWIKESLSIAKDSGFALHPGIGYLAKLWDIGGDHARVPSEDEIDEALLKLRGDINIEEKDEVSTNPDEVQVDLGALGKGIGADACMNYLKEQEDISGAIISVGGSLCVYGEKPDGNEWTVGIQDPRQEDGTMMGFVSVNGGTFVSTSGDYEKYIEKDGRRYHHILDSKTGYPAQSGLISVTIISKSGIDTDGLSTACFVLGIDESIPLLEKYDAEAVFVDEKHQVYKTPGADFELQNTDDYTMKELNK